MNSADNERPMLPNASASPDPLTNPPLRLSPKPVRPAETSMSKPVDSASTALETSDPHETVSTEETKHLEVKPAEVSKAIVPEKPTEAAVVEPSVESDPVAETAVPTARYHPIPPASEPMQYRAIGLVAGRYTPSEEQFTRGELVTQDGVIVQAVLLGRVMSLVKKHLDLENSHLWVVYPRTREKQSDLHVQIVGVWEPEKLTKKASEDEAEVDSESANSPSEAVPTEELALDDGYFSIRGEILFHSEDDDRIIVRIQQAPKKGSDEDKSFKLNLIGKLQGKTVGYFWELNVHRQGNDLVIQNGTMIGLVPPRKRTASSRPSFQRGGPGGFKKPWKGPSKGGPRNFRRDDGGNRGVSRDPGRESGRSGPPASKEAIAKPIKRPKEE